MSACVLFWRKPGCGLEEALKVTGTHFDCPGNLAQAWWFVSVLDEPARDCDCFRMFSGKPNTFGVTTFTGAKACLFSVI
jgi:hypothetical protein